MSKRKLLVVIDMQNDFVTGTLGSKDAEKIVEKIEKKILKEIAEGTELIFTKDTHREDYLSTQEGRNLPVKHCIEGTNGWEIVDKLKEYTKIQDYLVMTKNTFGSIELAKYIYKNRSLFDNIELVGLCTDICVISNAILLKAAVPEIKISVDSSCCAGVTKESHQNALEAMKMCQIEIL